MPPRAAYVHVPFCARRCGYCNFTLVAGRDDLREDYLRAAEMELAGHQEPREVDTLFFGGGTPTQLSCEQMERLIAIVLRWFPLALGGEFSVEANPADVTPEMADALRAGGVTRVSLGAQSFRGEKLRQLDRDHAPDDIRAAVERCRRFASVSIDLIFAAPGETLAQWEADVDAAIALVPDHVSTYGLTWEKGTAFWSRRQHGELAPVDEETERAMYTVAIDRLSTAGFEHYEVSNFARLSHRCRHNETYWLGEPYFAVGPGAARYINGRREMNHRSTTTYLARVLSGQSPVAESEQLSPEDAARERLVFALRRLAGVRRDWFTDRTGFSIDALVGEPLRRFADLGLLADDGQTIHLTRAGLFVSDSLWPRFLTA